jgi:hypothetical protein
MYFFYRYDLLQLFSIVKMEIKRCKFFVSVIIHNFRMNMIINFLKSKVSEYFACHTNSLYYYYYIIIRGTR